MDDDRILDYYERELTFIRQMGMEFARKYPKIARRLLLEADKCEDPHTERLIEAFALISGRIHKKIEDDFPEITESVLNIVYPHYVNPIPSMSIVKFEPDIKAIPPVGYVIEKNTPLFSKPVGGVPCQFMTTYPLTLLPIEVTSAALQEPKKLMKNAQQALTIQLRSFNKLAFSEVGTDRMRFYLNGPPQHIYHLYELLFNNVCHVECESTNRRGLTEAIPMAPGNIKPVGFNPDEGMLPFPRRSFPGYLLLFEYFCFPEKFLFFDIDGLDQIKRADVNDTLDIWIYFDRLPKPNLVINRNTFCINASPVVNLFARIAEPIRVEHRKTEYHLIPDLRRQEGTEVFSIDSVSASSAASPGKMIEFKPFYSTRHHLDDIEGDEWTPYWHHQRRSSGKKDDDGTEVFLSFTDLDFRRVDPDAETLTVHVTCTNRDLPARLPFGDPLGDFDMEIAAPVARINCLLKPTPVRRPSLAGALQWRLISHLSLNYMSLVEGGGEALKEILKLYDFDNSPVTRQQIDGIVSVKSQHVTKRVRQSFCRGVEVTMEFDEEQYIGTGLYLFACVLERFLGQYVSVNSFSQMIARTIQRKEALKKWSPRNGNRVLL